MLLLQSSFLVSLMSTIHHCAWKIHHMRGNYTFKIYNAHIYEQRLHLYDAYVRILCLFLLYLFFFLLLSTSHSIFSSYRTVFGTRQSRHVFSFAFSFNRWWKKETIFDDETKAHIFNEAPGKMHTLIGWVSRVPVEDENEGKQTWNPFHLMFSIFFFHFSIFFK